VLLPSCACVIGISHAYIAGVSHACDTGTFGASCVDSPSTGASWCTTVGREEIGGSLVGSPALVADGAAKVGCVGVTKHTADQRMIIVAEVRLLPPRNHLLSSGIEIVEAGAT
jgi:hypothetical protein